MKKDCLPRGSLYIVYIVQQYNTARYLKNVLEVVLVEVVSSNHTQVFLFPLLLFTSFFFYIRNIFLNLLLLLKEGISNPNPNISSNIITRRLQFMMVITLPSYLATATLIEPAAIP